MYQFNIWFSFDKLWNHVQLISDFLKFQVFVRVKIIMTILYLFKLKTNNPSNKISSICSSFLLIPKFQIIKENKFYSK